MPEKRKLRGIADLYIVEDAKKTAPANSVAPPDNVSAPNSTAAPIPDATLKPVAASIPEVSTEVPRQPIHFVAATKPVAPPIIEHPEQFLRIPNEIADKILPTLKPTEQVVLLRLYRLSRGFQNDRCQVSIKKLASACKMGTTQTRIATQELEKRGLIRRVSIDLSNANQTDRGIAFEMLLPGAVTTKNVGAVKTDAATNRGATTQTGPIKETTTKETTQTQQGVSVLSRFTLEECRRYAEHLHKTGQGIRQPAAYATSIYRSGEADEQIATFLSPAASKPSTCPLCASTGGFIYPSGEIGQGPVKKCEHGEGK
jgi:hypothetical protein